MIEDRVVDPLEAQDETDQRDEQRRAPEQPPGSHKAARNVQYLLTKKFTTIAAQVATNHVL